MKKAIAIFLVVSIITLSCRVLPFGFGQPTSTPPRITTFPELPPKASTQIPPQVTSVSQEETTVTFEGQIPPIAFVATGWCVPGSSREIFLMNPDGSGIVCITNALGDDYDPNWSPDGEKIVFISEREGNNDIFIMNADGSEQTQLTYTKEDEHFPAFSPDGKFIVYSSEYEDGTNLYILGIGASEPSLIEFPGIKKVNCKYPDWSPDGDWLVFSCFGGDMKAGIYIAHPDGSDLQLVKGGPLHNPVWSPDGEMIAFDGEPTGCKFEVYVMKKDGSQMKQVTENPEGCGGYSKHPAWNPDGTQLIFSSQRHYSDGQGFELFSINLDGSGETQLTDSSHNDLYHSPFDAVWAKTQ